MSKSITDELRHEVANYPFRDNRDFALFEAIADRIDAAHEDALVSSYFNGVFSDGELAENGFMRLPKDIDDKPIDEHDKIDWRDHEGRWRENKTVVAVCRDGCYVLDGMVFHVHKSDIRHHKQLTVEDVLREFGKAWVEWEDGSPYDPIAKFADKLQLRGDAE